MPTYDYLCAACGHRFEEFQSMSADALKKCPACKKQKLERLIGAGAGVIFKGSGFYQTDYRDGSYAKDAKKDDAPSGGCAPTCGTDAAPTGCSTPKTDAPKADKPKKSKSD
jgi:putative FmdB family regulatory protein